MIKHMKWLAATSPHLMLAVGSCLVIGRRADMTAGVLLGIGAGVALSGSV